MDLDDLAAVAGVSKYHFARSFAATYGETPIRYLTRRRIERAQDLLRTANLTVTEICMAVGFSSLGSFSARFSALVGESPREYRNRWAAQGGPRMPGCYLFMCGVLDLDGDRRSRPGWSGSRNLGEANRAPRRLPSGMITNVSLTTVYCLDQDAARDFYVDVLGFEPNIDVPMGPDFRWVTINHPNQPELEVTLMTPGPPLDPEAADFVRRQLEKGQMGGLGLRVDDCRKTHQELVEKGVTFLQEPADRPYGVEAVIRDNSGNWLVLVEPKEFSPEGLRLTPLLASRKASTAITRRLTSPSSIRPSFWKTTPMCFSTARSLQEQRLGDRRVVPAGSHLGQHVALPVGQPVQRRLGLPRAPGHQPLDDLRIERGAAAADLLQRADQFVDLRDAFLEQVAESGDPVGEQVEGQVVLGVLGQHHHTDRSGVRRGSAWPRRCPPR